MLNGINRVMSLQFYLGPARSGAPQHWHTAALNSQAYGRKRWYVFPPGNASYSLKPTNDWLREDYEPGLRQGLEFTQEAGDVVFLPGSWGHLTYNEATSIGVAMEFDAVMG